MLSKRDAPPMAPIDLYSLPHKALRVAVAQAGTVLSATDPDRLDTDLVVVRGVLAELCDHAAHEDVFIHPLLARLAPAVEAELTVQHHELDAAIDDLHRRIDRAESGTTQRTESALGDLHRAYQRVAAQNLFHLDHEETVAMPALWARASSVSLGELMDRFRAAHPDAGEIYRRWPDGLTRDERTMVGAI
jgi:hypothetical protein